MVIYFHTLENNETNLIVINSNDSKYKDRIYF
jgi:hypothetical protein